MSPPQPNLVEILPEPQLIELDILEDIPDLIDIPEEVIWILVPDHILC